MSSENRKILITDDEVRMRALVRNYLRVKGFQMLEAGNGREALEVFQWEPDIALILLDVMMPEVNGFETLKEPRHISDAPVLMLTVRAEEQDELQGLPLGADKCIAKLSGPKVLFVRIDAILKCASAGTGDEQPETAGICLDERAHKVTASGKKVEFSFKEFELLRYFLENQGIALSREKIPNHAWNYDYLDDVCTIDTYVKKLRVKMGEKGALIWTIWGMGYKLEPEEA